MQEVGCILSGSKKQTQLGQQNSDTGGRDRRRYHMFFTTRTAERSTGARFVLSAGTGATAITGAASAISFDDHHQQSLEDCSGFVHRYTNGATGFLIAR